MELTGDPRWQAPRKAPFRGKGHFFRANAWSGEALSLCGLWVWDGGSWRAMSGPKPELVCRVCAERLKRKAV